MSTSIVWLNGKLAGDDEARLSPFDHGVLVGDGVFETLKVISGKPFALRRHLDRLRRSARPMRLEVPGGEVLHDAVFAVVEANESRLDGGVGRLRITVTGGPGPLGSARGNEGPTVLVTAGPPASWAPTTTVAIAPWPRSERGAVTGLKTISYAENVVALAYADDHGATEALFGNLADNLCEGTGSNVFVGIDGRLVTPPLTAGCLAGITRELLLEVTEAIEADVPLAALADADEMFLASTTREVQPIASVDGRALPAAPGRLTTGAAKAFADLVATNLDP